MQNKYIDLINSKDGQAHVKMNVDVLKNVCSGISKKQLEFSKNDHAKNIINTLIDASNKNIDIGKDVVNYLIDIANKEEMKS